MDQETYLAQLKEYIKSLPKEEQEDVLEDYSEHFEFARSKGKSDQEIIRGLGNSEKVAKEVILQYEITNADSNPTLNSLKRAVFLAMGLGLFNIIFVLIPFLCLLFIIISFFVFSFLLLLSPLILVLQEGFTLTLLKEGFLIIGYIGLGILLFLMSLNASKLLYRGLLKYLSFNLNKVRRKTI